MISTYFGDIRNGSLKRLPYLGYSLLLGVIVLAFVFAVVLAIGAGEHLLGGDLTKAQQTLRETLGIPFFIVFVLFLLVVFFASLNIAAKRARDIGLPGWLVVLGIVIVSLLLSTMVSNDASNGFSGLIFLALLLTPTDMFKRE